MRWKQYQSVSQEMMEQICDLETVKLQEISVKVCVIYYIEICYRGCGEKTSFLAIIYYTQVYSSSLINGGGVEAATRGVLRKKVFLKISQISRENSCVGVSF